MTNRYDTVVHLFHAHGRMLPSRRTGYEPCEWRLTPRAIVSFDALGVSGVRVATDGIHLAILRGSELMLVCRENYVVVEELDSASTGGAKLRMPSTKVAPKTPIDILSGYAL